LGYWLEGLSNVAAGDCDCLSTGTVTELVEELGADSLAWFLLWRLSWLCDGILVFGKGLWFEEVLCGVGVDFDAFG
jgi:hypothetical protein